MTEKVWFHFYTEYNPFLSNHLYMQFKHIFDFIMALIGLIILFPLFLLIIVLQKIINPNSPVFFMQDRTGSNGIRFKMIKFRSMVKGADRNKQEFAKLNNLSYPDFKIENDPRVTQFGKLLRKTSLDEIPQLINILKGEMSLVGPRPTSFDIDTYSLWHTERLDIMPGLTGLWQATSRGESEFDYRVSLDIFYIKHQCFLFDIHIILKTITAVLKGRGVA